MSPDPNTNAEVVTRAGPYAETNRTGELRLLKRTIAPTGYREVKSATVRKSMEAHTGAQQSGILKNCKVLGHGRLRKTFQFETPGRHAAFSVRSTYPEVLLRLA